MNDAKNVTFAPTCSLGLPPNYALQTSLFVASKVVGYSAAGAEIAIDIKDEEHGGRAYSCRDPEGHVWNFGSYDPWSV